MVTESLTNSALGFRQRHRRGLPLLRVRARREAENDGATMTRSAGIGGAMRRKRVTDCRGGLPCNPLKFMIDIIQTYGESMRFSPTWGVGDRGLENDKNQDWGKFRVELKSV